MLPEIINKNTFRYKVMRAFGLAMIVGLLTAFFVTSFVGYRTSEKNHEENVQVLASIFGNRSVAALVFGDSAAASKNLSASRFDESIDVICLYKDSGKLFAKFRTQVTELFCEESQARPLDDKPVIKSDFRSLVISSPIYDNNDYLGHITIYSNKKSIQNSLLQFGLSSLVIFIASWLIISLLTNKALARIMSPLEELTLTVKDITYHKLYETRARKLSNDEIGELVEVFNQMLDSIAQENLALKQSETRFRTLTTGSPVGIFQCDLHGQMVYANDKWSEVTGLSSDRSDEFPNHILKRFRRQYENFWKNISERNVTQVIEFGYKNPVTGEIKSFMEYVSVLYGSEGTRDGCIGTLLDVSELKNAQMELEKLAFYDPLTSLPNRRFFRDHLNFILADARHHTKKVAVLMLDLDNFKKVNDSLGHDTGDSLLKAIAARMLEMVPDTCVLSRMGGDEFLFLLNDTSADAAAVIGQRILDTISEEIEISEHVLEITGSFGISIYPDDGLTSHDLMKNADMALYNAKDKGRNQVNFYSRELDRHIKDNLRLESKLLQAINNEILNVYLQPFYATQEKKLVWAEALLRWHDKDEGFIPPDRFIPLAESLGVIRKLGRFVLNQTCYHLSKNRNYLTACGINGISINLSALEFFSRSFLPEIKHILRDSGVEPSSIEFEITESIVMDDSEHAIQIMRSLRDLGCKLCIDDFGTGYSSLSYLKRFPITSLKIDQSFVTDIPEDKNDVEICTAIIAMAHKLGLAIVAEGVETHEQKEFLIEQGCEYLQGFLFARPESVNEIIKRGRQNAIRIVK